MLKQFHFLLKNSIKLFNSKNPEKNYIGKSSSNYHSAVQHSNRNIFT